MHWGKIHWGKNLYECWVGVLMDRVYLGVFSKILFIYRGWIFTGNGVMGGICFIVYVVVIVLLWCRCVCVV